MALIKLSLLVAAATALAPAPTLRTVSRRSFGGLVVAAPGVASAAGNCCSCDAALGYDCPLSLLGADADAHGCLASAGYAWCASSGTCERAFEGGCESAPSSRARARGAPPHYGM